MRHMPILPPKPQQPLRTPTHQLESQEEQTLRQYLEANNLLSRASRAIGEQMKSRRAESRVDA